MFSLFLPTLAHVMHLNRSFTDSSHNLYSVKAFPLLPHPPLTANTSSCFSFFFNLGVSLIFLLQKCGTNFNFKLQLHFNSDDAFRLKSVQFCLFLPHRFQYGLHRHPGSKGSISAEPPSCVILRYCVPGFLRCSLHWKTQKYLKQPGVTAMFPFAFSSSPCFGV